jgi:hypothetical protein
VSFGFSPTPLTGMAKLVQIVVLSLLNVPGQDILDPISGGGLPELVGSNIDATDTTELLAEVARRVKKTQTEVIQSQVGLDLIAEERLREIKIVSTAPGETIDEVLIKLRVINEAGRSSDLVV